MDRESYIKYNFGEENKEYEISTKVIKKDDNYIRNRIKEILNGEDSFKLGQLSKEERDKIISLLINEEKFSIRQIERVTGISRGVGHLRYVPKSLNCPFLLTLYGRMYIIKSI